MIDVTRKVRRVDDHKVTGDVFDSGRDCDCPLIVVLDKLATTDGVTFPATLTITRDGQLEPDCPRCWENVPEVRTVEAWVVAYEDNDRRIFYKHPSYTDEEIEVLKVFGIKHVSVPIERGEGL